MSKLLFSLLKSSTLLIQDEGMVLDLVVTHDSKLLVFSLIEQGVFVCIFKHPPSGTCKIFLWLEVAKSKYDTRGALEVHPAKWNDCAWKDNKQLVQL